MYRLGTRRGEKVAAGRALVGGASRWGGVARLRAAVRPRAFALVALALVAGLGLAGVAGPARANGTPIRIVLSYLNGVSNFGPTNATGVAELITSEGEVRLTAAGLQKLGPADEYRLWIVSNQTNERLTLGTFEAGDDGVARLDRVLRDPIPEKPWDLMVVTVEPKGAEPQAPGERRAIAGRFPSVPGGGAQPGQLPNTGDDRSLTGTAGRGVLGLSTGGTILLALLVAGAVGFALGRVGARRGA